MYNQQPVNEFSAVSKAKYVFHTRPTPDTFSIFNLLRPFLYHVFVTSLFQLSHTLTLDEAVVGLEHHETSAGNIRFCLFPHGCEAG